MEKLQKVGFIPTLILLVFIFMGQCSGNRAADRQTKKIEALAAKVDSLQSELNKRPSSTEVKEMTLNAMYNFLIYEDDLDKNKISLSEIKDKIEKDVSGK